MKTVASLLSCQPTPLRHSSDKVNGSGRVKIGMPLNRLFEAQNTGRYNSARQNKRMRGAQHFFLPSFLQQLNTLGSTHIWRIYEVSFSEYNDNIS